jgi:hypothetical protein
MLCKENRTQNSRFKMQKVNIGQHSLVSWGKLCKCKICKIVTQVRRKRGFFKNMVNRRFLTQKKA